MNPVIRRDIERLLTIPKYKFESIVYDHEVKRLKVSIVAEINNSKQILFASEKSTANVAEALNNQYDVLCRAINHKRIIHHIYGS